MRPTEFAECLEKLRGVFGKNHYPELRAKALWIALSSFPDGLMSKAVDKIILGAKNAPLYADLKEAIEFAARQPQSAHKLIPRECGVCGANGVVLMVGYLVGEDSRTEAWAHCTRCEFGRSLVKPKGQRVCPTDDDLSQIGFVLKTHRANIPKVEGLSIGLTALCWNMHKSVLEGQKEPPIWNSMLSFVGITPEEAWEAYELEWKMRKPGRINEKIKNRGNKGLAARLGVQGHDSGRSAKAKGGA